MAQNSSGETGYFVTTTQLNARLQSWVEYVKEHPNTLKTRDHYDQCFHMMQGFQTQSPLIRRSIRHSVDTICKNTAVAIDRALGVVGASGSSVRERKISDEDLHIMVNEMSWCPFRAARAWEDATSVNSQILMRSLRLPRSNKEHASCTRWHCGVAQIRPATFVPSHATPDCDCKELFSPDVKAMKHFLEDGRIPMLKVTYNSHGVLDDVDVVAYTEGIHYIALSHVWADGLGNPLSNGIPTCQFHHLCEKLSHFSKISVASLSNTFFFWLDTLCVPVAPKEAKILAMARMQDVYRDAAHVLVLDRDLQSIDFDEDCIFVPGILITTSQWVWRLWTLQEAILADRLWFRFKDRSIEISEFWRKLHAKLPQAPFNQWNIYIEVLIKIQALRFHARRAWLSQEYDLDSLRVAVQFRAVSVPADEALCLATLTDVKINAEEKFPGDRMSKFWIQYAAKYNIGNEIIFNNFPRLQVPGFGWAPSTLLRFQIPSSSRTNCFFKKPSHVETQATTQGIRVTYPGLMLELASSEFSVQDIFQRAQVRKLPFVNILDKISGTWLHLAPNMAEYENISKFTSDREFAVIMHDRKGSIGRNSLVTKIEANEDSAVSVKSIMPCNIYECSLTESRILSLASRSNGEADIRSMWKERLDTAGQLFARWNMANDLPSQQVWEVGVYWNLMEDSYFVIRRHFAEDQSWVVG